VLVAGNRETGGAGNLISLSRWSIFALVKPVLRIMASLQGRISDLIVARDLVDRGVPPHELTRLVGRGNARIAERVVEAARRYRPLELERMLRGLFEADLAIKRNDIEPEAAITAWLGEQVLAGRTVG